MNWNGKKVAFLGYGIDVQDVEVWLKEKGAILTILNEKEDPNAFQNLASFDVLVRSPGVYRYRDEIVAAEKAGVVVTSKMNIFFEESPTKNIIGVTGTKGKGTTSSLIFQMLKNAGKKVFLGGNIGKGIFEDIAHITPDAWVVLELSSFQLFDLHASPHIAVTLMVTSDHLDWHKDLEEYVHAKSAITRFQKEGDVSIYNDTYERSVHIGLMGEGRKKAVRRADWNHDVRLRGDHNRENFAAAAAAAREAGVSEEIILATAKEFKGLEHRLEEVGEVAGVMYYDDSISTTPDTAIAAMHAFHENITIILGGSDKGADFTALGEEIAKNTQVTGVVLLGQTANKIKEALIKASVTCKIQEGAQSMAEVVNQARNMAKEGSVVILSPACASFDMFKNYKDRGDQFKAEVLKKASVK